MTCCWARDVIDTAKITVKVLQTTPAMNAARIGFSFQTEAELHLVAAAA
jgi:hypothetical protein